MNLRQALSAYDNDPELVIEALASAVPDSMTLWNAAALAFEREGGLVIWINDMPVPASKNVTLEELMGAFNSVNFSVGDPT